MVSINFDATKFEFPDLPADYARLSTSQRKQVRDSYIAKQGGKCLHCQHDLDGDPSPEVQNLPVDWSRFPPGFVKHGVHLHHDHKTGLTIGAVHARCNAVLWQYHGE